MPATEHDHNRAHATYFGRTEEMGVEPLVEDYTFSGDGYTGAVFIDPVAFRTFVFWSDGVANDWCQEVNDARDAVAFLSDLAAADAREDHLFTEEEFAKWATR